MRRFPGCRVKLLTRLPKGLRSAELGVLGGDYSSKIFQYTEPAHHIMVDLWGMKTHVHVQPGEICGQLFNSLYYGWTLKRFELQLRHGVGTIQRMLIADALKAMSDDSLDWAYIDGDHKYDAVLSDLRGVKRVVKPTGFIAGHDYFPGVPSVMDAVADFLDENKDMCLVLVTTDNPPSFVIARRDMDAHYAKLFME